MKNIKFAGKIILTSFLLSLVAAGLVSCSKKSEITAAVLNGPSSLSLAKLFETDVNMKVLATPDTLIPLLIKGELDFGVLPVNTAAKLCKATNGKIKICAICGYTSLFLLTGNKNINSIRDLNGKTVYSCGYSAIPEYMLRFLLEQNDVTLEGDVNFSIPNAELASSIAAGKIESCFLTEPFVTLALNKNPGLSIAFDAQEEFGKTPFAMQHKIESLPVTCIVVRSDFAKENKQSVQKFLELCRNSVEFVNAHPEEAGILSEKHQLGLSSEIARRSIPNSNFAFKSAESAKDEINSLFEFINVMETNSINYDAREVSIYLE